MAWKTFGVLSGVCCRSGDQCILAAGDCNLAGMEAGGALYGRQRTAGAASGFPCQPFAIERLPPLGAVRATGLAAGCGGHGFRGSLFQHSRDCEWADACQPAFVWIVPAGGALLWRADGFVLPCACGTAGEGLSGEDDDGADGGMRGKTLGS